jgi:hypothetical protein
LAEERQDFSARQIEIDVADGAGRAKGFVHAANGQRSLGRRCAHWR